MKALLGGAGALVAGLVAIAVIIALGVGGWYFGWHMKTANTNRQAHLDRSNFAFQQTLREQVTKDIADVRQIDVQVTQTSGQEAAALNAQRVAIVSQLCQENTQITGDPLPASQSAFVTANCN